jgi:orotidine-5'-phosphate decarboxylase
MERGDFDLKNPKEAKDRLIVALDVATREEAEELIAELGDTVSFYKVGLQLFVAEGMAFARDLVGQGKQVFMDLKMDDVEETIALAVCEITKSNVSFLTIHGNGATARAANRGRKDSQLPKILSVTLLTSLDGQDLMDLGILGARGKFSNLDQYVDWRAEKAIEAGCDGVIAAGPSVTKLRANHPDALIVTPGVRLAGTNMDDHKRATTPREAIAAGSDYLVVGRPIRDAENRRDMAGQIIQEIEQGLAERNAPSSSFARAS